MVFIRLLCGCGVTRFNNSDGNRGNNPTTVSTSQFQCCSVLIGAQKHSTWHFCQLGFQDKNLWEEWKFLSSWGILSYGSPFLPVKGKKSNEIKPWFEKYSHSQVMIMRLWLFWRLFVQFWLFSHNFDFFPPQFYPFPIIQTFLLTILTFSTQCCHFSHIFFFWQFWLIFAQLFTTYHGNIPFPIIQTFFSHNFDFFSQCLMTYHENMRKKMSQCK